MFLTSKSKKAYLLSGLMQSIDWDVFQRRWFPIFWQRRRLFWGEEFGCKREKKSRTRPENQSHSIEKILSRCRPPLSLSLSLYLYHSHTPTHTHTLEHFTKMLWDSHTHTYTNHTLSYLHSPHSNTCTEFLYLFSSHSLTHTRTPYWHSPTHTHTPTYTHNDDLLTCLASQFFPSKSYN